MACLYLNAHSGNWRFKFSFASAGENSDPNLLFSSSISAQGAGCSALGALSTIAVSFSGLLIRMWESLDKEEGKNNPYPVKSAFASGGRPEFQC